MLANLKCWRTSTLSLSTAVGKEASEKKSRRFDWERIMPWPACIIQALSEALRLAGSATESLTESLRLRGPQCSIMALQPFCTRYGLVQTAARPAIYWI